MAFTDLALIASGTGTAGWTVKELWRQSREIKKVTGERDAYKRLADEYHSDLLAKSVQLAKSESRFAAMQGQLTALTEKVDRQTDEIKELRAQLTQMEGGHA